MCVGGVCIRAKHAEAVCTFAFFFSDFSAPSPLSILTDQPQLVRCHPLLPLLLLFPQTWLCRYYKVRVLWRNKKPCRTKSETGEGKGRLRPKALGTQFFFFTVLLTFSYAINCLMCAVQIVQCFLLPSLNLVTAFIDCYPFPHFTNYLTHPLGLTEKKLYLTK